MLARGERLRSPPWHLQLIDCSSVVPATLHSTASLLHTTRTMAIYNAVPPPPGLGGAPVPLEGTTTTSTIAHDHHVIHPVPAAPTDAATQSPPLAHTTTATTSPPAQQASIIDIEAWAVSAIESLAVSPAPAGRPQQQPLSIPLDEELSKTRKVSIDPRAKTRAVTPPPRPTSARDSQKRREANLKGKEGSRQRRRWENGTCTLLAQHATAMRSKGK